MQTPPACDITQTSEMSSGPVVDWKRGSDVTPSSLLSKFAAGLGQIFSCHVTQDDTTLNEGNGAASSLTRVALVVLGQNISLAMLGDHSAIDSITNISHCLSECHTTVWASVPYPSWIRVVGQGSFENNHKPTTLSRPTH